MNTLETEIVDLYSLSASTGKKEHIEALTLKKTLLANLLDIKAQGALVRSRFQNITQMDAPSKFFFSMEKKNSQSRIIHSLVSDTGQELTKTSEIREVAVQFYKKLYTADLINEKMTISGFFEGLPKLDEESNESLQQHLTEQELYTAMMGMENGKSPGIDGLPIEFYKTFWPVLREDLLVVFDESLTNGFLPLSCRRAVITLLPKKGDLQNIKNWRPVSLLCSEYKILSKTLATRLSKIIGKVIHYDQTYCVPNRSIFDNITLIRDVLEVSKLFGINIGLISLDQEKAFDRVEHLYLWHTLQAFGFNSRFIDMIKTMYCEIESVIKINGSLCAPFNVQRGVRQGCAMSGLLYVLAIEPLLSMLRNKLKGLTLPQCNNAFHLSAYADDVIVFINDSDDVKMLQQIVNDFKDISSAIVNWGKSDALLIGKWEGENPILPGGLLWKKDGLKYLGVFLGNEAFMQKNWEGMADKVTGRLKKWKWLLPQLSFKGRTLIINNLAASSLWHRLACVDPPVGLLAKIQTETVNFFWDNLHWIPQSVLFLAKEDGGQGLVHLSSRCAAYRLQFLQKLLIGSERLVWRPVAQSILHRISGLGLDNVLFLMDSKKFDFRGVPAFYRNLFKIWSLFKPQWMEPLMSLYWLLEEPIVCGARLDVSGDEIPGLKDLLYRSGSLQLKHILNKAGSDFNNVEAVSAFLKVKSARYIKHFLDKLQGALNVQERILLDEYNKKCIFPDCEDFFPDISIVPDLSSFNDINSLLKKEIDVQIDFFEVKGKALYRSIVKVTNIKWLNRSDTVWRDTLEITEKTKPVWRILYKPPLPKRVGDLQWRILHGAIAVNSFVAMLNPNVSENCPFCNERETVFHCFMFCNRLPFLFSLLELLFESFEVCFTKQDFILGCMYTIKKKYKCQLLNFIVGIAKLAIYITRRNKIEQKGEQELITAFKKMVKSRLVIEFNFYKLMSTLNIFEIEWCCDNVLCSLVDNELVISEVLM